MRSKKKNDFLPSLNRAFYKVYPEVGLEVAAYLRERFGKGYTACSLLEDERDRPNWWSRNDGVETMAMPQRGDTIEAIKRRAAEKKAAEEKKKAEARARAVSRGCDRMW